MFVCFDLFVCLFICITLISLISLIGVISIDDKNIIAVLFENHIIVIVAYVLYID